MNILQISAGIGILSLIGRSIKLSESIAAAPLRFYDQVIQICIVQDFHAAPLFSGPRICFVFFLHGAVRIPVETSGQVPCDSLLTWECFCVHHSSVRLWTSSCDALWSERATSSTRLFTLLSSSNATPTA